MMLGLKNWTVTPALKHRALVLTAPRRTVVTRVAAPPEPAGTSEAPPPIEAKPTTTRRPRPAADGFLIRESTKPRGLAKSLLASDVLSVSESKPEVSLKLTCASPDAVPRAIMAVAHANMQLAEQNSPFRIQVSSAVRREPGEGVYVALNRGQYTALMFLTKVATSSLVPVTDSTPKSKVSKSTAWTKLAKHVELSFTTNQHDAATLIAAGPQQLLSAYQAMILSRYHILKAERVQQQDASSPSTDTPATPQKRGDFSFVPSISLQSLEGGLELVTAVLHLQRCVLPARSTSDEMRMVTPRPARSRADSPRPTRERRARTGTRANDAETVTVAVSEWNSMKERLDAMVTQHEQLMKLLTQEVNAEKGQPGSK